MRQAEIPFTSRSNWQIICDSIESTFVTTILGARRVGKTALTEHYAAQHSEYLWVSLNMDQRSQREQIKKEQLEQLIEEQAEQQIGGDKKIWVLIDEAQKCPAIFDQIKILYDKYSKQNKIKFILTGSGYLSLHKLSSETLAGRVKIHALRTFGLHEIALLNRPDLKIPKVSIFDTIINECTKEALDNAIASIAPFKQSLMNALEEELVWGGLPEVLQLKENEKRISYLSNYLDTYFEKDIRALNTISDISLYQNLMEIISEQTGSVRDDQKILQALGCTRTTLQKYRGYLQATLMYQEIHPFIKSSVKRLVKAPKGYLINNGLISFFSGLYDLAPLTKTGLIGHRFENWVLKELNIWLDRDPRRSKIYYFRTHGGVEVDFIVDKSPYVLPIEVTTNRRIERKKQKHLLQFLALEKSATVGVYIYNGPYQYDEKLKIVYLPAWAVGI